MAQTFYWIGGSHDLGTAGSWETYDSQNDLVVSQVVPTASDNEEVDVDGTLTGTGTATQLSINAAVSIDGMTDVTTGNLIGSTQGANGTVTVGAGSQWITNGRIFVGGSGAGTLLISGGGFVSATGLGSTSELSIYAAENAGSTGLIEVTGSASALTSTGRLGVGVNGAGEMDILNGATVSTSFPPTEGYSGVFIGGNTGASGVVFVSGSASLLDAGDSQIGIAVPGSLDGPVATGTLIVTAGAHVVGGPGASTQAGFLVGWEGNVNAVSSITAAGYVTLDGTGSELSVEGVAQIGDSGDGVLAMSNGATAILGENPGTADGGVNFGLAAGATGLGTIASGASLSSLGSLRIGYFGTGTVVVESGADLSSFLDTADIAAGQGGIIVAASASSSGVLTVTGSGSGFSTNGDLVVGRGGTGTLALENGATGSTTERMRIGWGGNPGSYVTGTGAVTVDGTGSMLVVGTLQDGLTGSGTLAGGVGSLQVTNGASLDVATSATLENGATMLVDSLSGIEIGGSGDALTGLVTIDAGGSLVGNGTIFGAVQDSGFLDATAGLLQLQGAASGSGTTAIETGGILEFASTIGNSANVTFNGAGMLKLDTPGGFTGTIDALPFGGTIDLVGDAGATATISGTTLEVSGPDGTNDFMLAGGDYSGIAVTTMSDAGTDALAGTDVSIACFCAGTRLLTDAGEVAVEKLAIGDPVVTRSGTVRRVKWVGWRSYSRRFIAGRRNMLPIVVAAGALADGVPRRDLILSPKHALYFDDVLIPAELLVNGRTITQPEESDDITYYHVELETHDILLAEGAAAESFIDLDSRMMFHNASTFLELYPEAVPAPSECAQRIEDGEALQAVRRRLAARAGLDCDHVSDAAIPGALDGRLDEMDYDGVSGWAFDATRPHSPIWLEVLVDDKPVGQVVANSSRADLVAAGKSDGRCAFSFRFPRLLSAGVAHMIALRRAEDGALLGAPVRLESQPDSPGILDGRIDVLDNRTIEGWARDLSCPDNPVLLDLLESGRVIGRVLANRPRPDLASAGLSACAFAVRHQAHPARLHLRRTSDGAPLHRSTMERALRVGALLSLMAVAVSACASRLVGTATDASEQLKPAAASVSGQRTVIPTWKTDPAASGMSTQYGETYVGQPGTGRGQTCLNMMDPLSLAVIHGSAGLTFTNPSSGRRMLIEGDASSDGHLNAFSRDGSEIALTGVLSGNTASTTNQLAFRYA